MHISIWKSILGKGGVAARKVFSLSVYEYSRILRPILNSVNVVDGRVALCQQQQQILMTTNSKPRNFDAKLHRSESSDTACN